MSNATQKLQIKPNGLVLYPREYFIDEANPEKNYVRGVTQKGKDVVIYLCPTDQAIQAVKGKDGATLPSIEEFAETRPTSTRRCVASENNSSEAPMGVLLAEQVKPLKGDFSSDHGKGTFVGTAEWMSMLQQQDYCPTTIGPGYIDVSFAPPDQETKKLIAVYDSLNKRRLLSATGEAALDTEEQMDNLQREIIGARKVFFSAVTLKPDETMSADLGDSFGISANDRIQAFTNMLKGPLEKYTEGGRYGGALIRVRIGDQVSSRLYGSVEMRYDGASGGVLPFEDRLQRFLKAFENRDLLKAIRNPVRRPDPVMMEIIPVMRTNMGPRSVDRYKNDLLRLSGSKIAKTYINPDFHRMVGIEDISTKGGYVYSLMAIRNAEATRNGKGNVLVSAFHSYTAPIANALLINPEDNRYTFSSPAQSPANKAPSQTSGMNPA
jgi:hypothetical protein